MNVSLIIAAAGSGRRFQKGLKAKRRFPKVFLPLGEKAILTHALDSFLGIPQIREILIAIPPGTERWVKTYILNGRRGPAIRLVGGGASRAESVWNALRKSSPRNEWILVHDGARPFPPKNEILKMLRRGAVSAPGGRGNPAPTDGFILARPVVPTIKRVSGKGEIIGTLDRSNLFEAETPQLVRRSVLLKAYKSRADVFQATDESSLIEFIGGRMKVLAYSGWNLKVTTSEDLRLAEAYHSGLTSSVTLGFGRDTHRLVEGRKLYLGGVRIPFEKGALGHSDGDALLHAVSDAILGAVGAGDIGEWFSDKNPKFKNIASEKILRKVLEEARKRRWVPAHVDTVILLERPRLGSHKKKIRKRLASLLGLEEASVSIKAKTMEGLGPEGEGRAVTCEALAMLRRPPGPTTRRGRRLP